MKKFSVIAFASFLIVSVASPAHAYLDPGTGAMIVQIVIGAIAGAAMTIRAFWHKISSRFRSGRPSGGSPKE
jgi:hypothetical protein